MLNAKAFSDLLSQNSDGRLCKRWFIMTPNGTLLSYSQPPDIKDLRKQAAVAVLAWQEHQSQTAGQHFEADGQEHPAVKMPNLLRTLTMETESSNLIIRRLQPQLLLVLEGGVPPRKRTFEGRVTPETAGSAPYPAQNVHATDSTLASAASSIAESAKSNAAASVLGLQRRKVDALATALAQELQKTGFKMPEGGADLF